MTELAVLGAGAGGTAAVVELCSLGHSVRLWNRSSDVLGAIELNGGVGYEGLLGAGRVAPQIITSNLGKAIHGVACVLVCVPTFAHADIAHALADADIGSIPVVLNPGHTGGALEFCAVFRSRGLAPPPTAELSTLTYIARKTGPERVRITGVAKRVRVACLPGGQSAVAAAMMLYTSAKPARDVLETSLANVNMVLHPPGAVLGAAWIEASAGDFRFYVDGVTPGVARVMEALDEERRAVAASFGHDLPTLVGEMAAIGTADVSAAASGDFVHAIRGGEVNRNIRAPESLEHRYYLEDFGYGLLPFIVLAEIAGLEVPISASLMRIGAGLVEANLYEGGRTAERMGIAGLDLRGLLSMLRPDAGGSS